MTLIETVPGESEADLRIATDAILQTLNPSMPNWWHPYEFRGTYHRDGKTFREFWCVAGSVQLWLKKLGDESGGREVISEYPRNSNQSNKPTNSSSPGR
jgi:hypothetical protein